MTPIDTNILIDILGDDPVWLKHSGGWLAVRRSRGPLLINEIVYGQLAAGFAAQNALDEQIASIGLTQTPPTRPALFLAGQAFRKYRRTGGSRGNALADFFNGAQASVERWPILTRDARRYRSYFPEVTLLGM